MNPHIRYWYHRLLRYLRAPFVRCNYYTLDEIISSWERDPEMREYMKKEGG